ncbi:hypothetical protein AMAG_20423 [Allomyces macrogynus ATCC 38327]|uniref:Uncharacterized protein n=1 Tax=Allomyces macrogynus (strain ATCC 38327) TaxID=578462 RepID=A0A0L0TB99_ALLM3|nr:hypothetical protein AMAG_20423 [Allomyces macrogynus ATCC 38327]|eukprot:KNE71986.1 hypothetical protein AMAG_20423 [Allomyces macrogynus ATCC 38327]
MNLTARSSSQPVSPQVASFTNNSPRARLHLAKPSTQPVRLRAAPREPSPHTLRQAHAPFLATTLALMTVMNETVHSFHARSCVNHGKFQKPARSRPDGAARWARSWSWWC